MRHVEKVAHVLGIDLPLLLSLSSEQDSQEVVLRFSLPKGVQLTVAEMKHAKQVMQEVLNALAKTQSGRGGGDAGGTDQA